jgi:hypothetical protein
MRYFKTLNRDRRPVVTLSLWGEDDNFKEHAEQLLIELLEEIKKND